jgi:hypothetical protein
MYYFLLILPILAYYLTTIFFLRMCASQGICGAFLKAHVAMFSFIAVSTELLSYFQLITRPTLIFFWLIFVGGSFVAVLHGYKRKDVPIAIGENILSRLKIFIIALIFFLITVTLITTILFPPNTWDSMTYHMPRVMHWIKNQSIVFYPTEIIRQNYQMPLAEYAILHLQVLVRSDVFAGVVQWINYIVIVCLAVLIAAEFDLNEKQQAISALIIASLPMAILQASSTQNDLVLSAFTASFALFMIRIYKHESIGNYIFASLSLGLALLTKGVAYLFCASVGLSLTIPILVKYKHDFRRLSLVAGKLSLVALFAILLNMGHLSRNHDMYGHPLPHERELYQNEHHSPMVLASNVARNIALHLKSPSGWFNDKLYGILDSLFSHELNNPETTWMGTRFSLPHLRYHEDLAGNFVHTICLLAAVLILPALWFRKRFCSAMWYALGILGCFLLFCWMLKWQPWAARLHTPLFVMAAPLMAMMLTAGAGKISKGIGVFLLCAMILQIFPFALANKSRSLISLDWLHAERSELYFQNRKELFADYDASVRIIHSTDASTVGLCINSDDWEYPFWALANQEVSGGVSISFRHVCVQNASSRYVDRDFSPQYVVATRQMEMWEHAQDYTPAHEFRQLTIYTRVDTLPVF